MMMYHHLLKHPPRTLLLVVYSAGLLYIMVATTFNLSSLTTIVMKQNYYMYDIDIIDLPQKQRPGSVGPPAVGPGVVGPEVGPGGVGPDVGPGGGGVVGSNKEEGLLPTFPTLTYGVELSYMFPMDVLEELVKINTTTTSAYHNDNNTNNTNIIDIYDESRRPYIDMIIKELQNEHSIYAKQYYYTNNNTLTSDDEGPSKSTSKSTTTKTKTTKTNTWTFYNERGGMELTSYLNPPKLDIYTIMNVLFDKNYFVNSDINGMHINIDVPSTTTTQQIKNVYKNFISVEDAIETIRTSSTSSVPGSAISFKYRYNFTSGKSIKQAYYDLDNDWKYFPYPAYNYRMKPSSSTSSGYKIKKESHNQFNGINGKKSRPNLCLTKKDDDNTTIQIRPRSIEFRGLQMSNGNDPNVVWSWIQFARIFVESSYNGIVLQPKERTLEEQWDILFDVLIRDQQIQSTLDNWRKYGMHNDDNGINPNQNQNQKQSQSKQSKQSNNKRRLIQLLKECHDNFMSNTRCKDAIKGMKEREQRQRRKQKGMK